MPTAMAEHGKVIVATIRNERKRVRCIVRIGAQQLVSLQGRNAHWQHRSQ